MKQILLPTIALLACLLFTAMSLPYRRQKLITPDCPDTYSNERKTSQEYIGNQPNQENSKREDTETLVSQLQLAPTAVDKLQILNKDSDFLFDFVNPPTDKTTAKGEGGRLVIGNRAVWPALTGLGVSMAAGFIGPCGLNTPHIHPRASEFFFSVNGTFRTFFIAENGAREVINLVKRGQATLFPQGALHYQTNLGCKPAHFVSVLSHEDPGASQIAQNFFQIDEETLSATLGRNASDLKRITPLLPANIALGLASCRKRCGIQL